MTAQFLKVLPPGLACLGTAACVALAAVSPAHAAAVTFQGELARDDTVQKFTLTLDGPGPLTVTSIGYAGGTTANGNPVAAGGFDSVLYLFSSAGDLLYQSDDGIDAPVDPATGEALDAAFSTASLAAGLYTVALTQADNYLLGFHLSDGFAQSGTGNFTAAFGCSNGSFCDYAGNNRTSAWAITFSGDTLAAVVPEPGSLALLLAAGVAAGAARRRQRGTTGIPLRSPSAC